MPCATCGPKTTPVWPLLALYEKEVLMFSWFRRKQPRRDIDPEVVLAQLTMSDDDIIGAALRPGFGPHDAAWRLNISRDGLLRQEVRIWTYPGEELRKEQG